LFCTSLHPPRPSPIASTNTAEQRPDDTAYQTLLMRQDEIVRNDRVDGCIKLNLNFNTTLTFRFRLPAWFMVSVAL
jgi:hypothetical protein